MVERRATAGTYCPDYALLVRRESSKCENDDCAQLPLRFIAM